VSTTRTSPALAKRPAPGPAPARADGPLSGYLPTLDGWRAVAVAMVVVYHALWESAPGAISEVKLGFLGVDVFFALSGFLICTRLLQERREQGRVSLGGFYVRRAFRILPPAFLYLAAVALLGLLGWVAVTGSELAACVLFCRNYFPRGTTGQGWYTVHYWSLSVEEHFYLLFPALLVFLRRDLRRLRWAVAGLALAVGLLRFLGPHILAWSGGRLPEGTFYMTRTHVRLDALFWGCFAALLVETHRGLLAWLLSPTLSLLLLAASVASFWIRGPEQVGVWVRALILPWMLVGTILHPHAVLGRLLEWAPLRWVGRISYSLYLWQQLFCVGEAHWRSPVLGPLQQWPWCLTGLLACAAGSYYLVERPLIRLGHRLAPAPKRGEGP
jgi:peptidoglycan/LPS O-acetylase OafA/YrhL